VFLGRDLATRPDYSEDTARQIDTEVRDIVMSSYDRARQILSENMPTLKRLSDALLEYETLEADDVNVILNGGAITREKPASRLLPPPPKAEKKEKRKILDALEGLGKMEPNKA
jgi:cell division protease FtsH